MRQHENISPVPRRLSIRGKPGTSIQARAEEEEDTARASALSEGVAPEGDTATEWGEVTWRELIRDPEPTSTLVRDTAQNPEQLATLLEGSWESEGEPCIEDEDDHLRRRLR